jgi:hypothetical protein
LAGGAECNCEIHPDCAAVRHPCKRRIPQLYRPAQISRARFQNSQVRRRIIREWIDAERMFVKIARLGGIPPLQFQKAHGGQCHGIVGAL